jgi:hypothetical protein
MAKFAKHAAKFYKKKEIDDNLEKEFETFKGLRVLAELQDSDGLGFWAENETRFPIMARLARRYLAIPASSAPSERVFSKYGIIWERRKCNLKPETANDIIFLNLNRGGNMPTIDEREEAED